MAAVSNICRLAPWLGTRCPFPTCCRRHISVDPVGPLFLRVRPKGVDPVGPLSCLAIRCALTFRPPSYTFFIVLQCPGELAGMATVSNTCRLAPWLGTRCPFPASCQRRPRGSAFVPYNLMCDDCFVRHLRWHSVVNSSYGAWIPCCLVFVTW